MELKAHRIGNIISAYKIGKAFCMKTEEEVYIKSEADKVFADKDKAFEYSQAVIFVDIEIIKKQKRKRCLAMANMCRAEMVFWDNYGAKHFDEKYANRKLDHFGKWGQRWLALYYKFK